MTNLNRQMYNVIGLMSGTSLDGLDIAFCRFTADNNGWDFGIVHAETKAYPEEWKQRLLSLETADALAFQQAHYDYGYYLGRLVSDFIVTNGINADFVSSHGHTIFHQPENRFTVQVGAGSAIAAGCKMPVICDFRSLDVALGGQGAPLVPIGDKLLFHEYEYCLNLGGFANISYEHKGKRIAYDICPVNIVMNAVAEQLGKPYDDRGEMARTGMVSNYLLNELNGLPYFRQAPDSPKSLGKEWVIKNIDPLLEQYEVDTNDLLCTLCEHVAEQVARTLESKSGGRLLITGGGAYNDFLVERIRALVPLEIVIPEKKVIEFKEALIFAFLGVLRMRNEVNCLKSVTGAREDSCGGAIYTY
ncbi:MAG: anhydro-N-acetylmuramic acid kinase [Bacteroidetes bacterium]|nr:anhydro-N-acetylmuramic acid kinase [Bacteroidota bacterium]